MLGPSTEKWFLIWFHVPVKSVIGDSSPHIGSLKHKSPAHQIGSIVQEILVYHRH